ncbi:hypothetical protein CGCF245_v015716 [Colletotrichum fructicola]|nr:hypothetical protein CGCF245_v015716 [Colletotrichum fructicola]
MATQQNPKKDDPSSNPTSPMTDYSISIYNVSSDLPAIGSQQTSQPDRVPLRVLAVLCLLNYICAFDGTVLSTAVVVRPSACPGSPEETEATDSDDNEGQQTLTNDSDFHSPGLRDIDHIELQGTHVPYVVE